MRAQRLKAWIRALLILITIIPLFPSRSHAEESAGITLRMDYFYLNPCEACRVGEEFSQRLDRLLGKEKEGVGIDLGFYNTFHSGSRDILKEYCDKYKVPEDVRFSYNILFIGDKYIFEDTDFDANVLKAFREAKAAAAAADAQGGGTAASGGIARSAAGGGDASAPDTRARGAPGAGSAANGPAGAARRAGAGYADTDSIIVYFYVSPCGSCEEADKFLKTLSGSYRVERAGQPVYSRLRIEKFNVGDLKSLELARSYFEAYRVPDAGQKAPIAFIGDTYLAGENEIKSRLAGEIRAGKGLDTRLLTSGTPGPQKPATALPGYEAAGVFLTGLVNGFNPCSLSMLLFFMSIILVKNVNVLKLGFSYIAGKFAAYFAIGTLFFNILGRLGTGWAGSLQGPVKALLLIVTALLVLFNLRDFFAARSERYESIRVQLPAALRRLNHGWIKKINVIDNPRLLLPVSFILGAAISAGEFLCTGQIYLATIIYMMKTGPAYDLRAAACFTLYGAALVLPLVLLTFAIHKGREIFDVSDILRRRMPLIKLINAAVFLAFALIIVFLF